MELSNDVRIFAQRDKVYAALNDTEVLQACIPASEELTRASGNVLEAKVVLKIGPVKAKFGGVVTLDPSQPRQDFRSAVRAMAVLQVLQKALPMLS